MTTQRYSAEDVLAEFDRKRREHSFIVLDGGKLIPADARITVYRNNEFWAVLMETLAYMTASPGFWGMIDLVQPIGNGYLRDDRVDNDTIQVIKDVPGDHAFLDPIGFHVNPLVHSISIRGQIVPVDMSTEALQRKGIPLPANGELSGEHLLWSLLPAHRAQLFAKESEKAERVRPLGLPKFMQLEEWNQPALIQDRLLPSQHETFRLLAEAISSGDATRYRPTLPPNTHWRNWLNFKRV